MNRRRFVTSSAALLASAPLCAAASSNVPVFSYHSDFRLNLHHALYAQADAVQAFDDGGPDALAPLQRRCYDEMGRAAAANRKAWDRALAFYQDTYGGRSLIFDAQMQSIENALVDGSEPADLHRTLASVETAYRQTLWPMHDRTNRMRIAQWQGFERQFAPALMPKLAALYRTPWPATPFRIDVVAHTDRDGAYSTSGPSDRFFHIVTSSVDRQNKGLSGYEVLVHEASHATVVPDAGAIGSAISAAARARNRPEPADLWHVVIMYVPGVVLRELCAATHAGPYVPAFVANGVLTHDYPRYYAALQRYVGPYVEGRVGLGSAIDSTVGAIVA